MTTTTTGLKALSVHSMGRYVTNTGAVDFQSAIEGPIGSLRVTTGIHSVAFSASQGSIGSVFVGGSVIGGSVFGSGTIVSDGHLGTVTIGGGLVGASGPFSGVIRSNGKIGSVGIGGSVVGGTGVSSGMIHSVGEATSIQIGGGLLGGPARSSGRIYGEDKIGSIRIGGSIVGGSADFTGLILANGAVGSITIGGDVLGGSASGTASLYASGVTGVLRLGSLTIGGSLISGMDATSGTFKYSGSIEVRRDIGTMLIKGSIIGNASYPVIITAQGQAAPTGSEDFAISKIHVLGRVEFAQILAGYEELEPLNADAQIGSVFVGGDWITSNLVAGAEAGVDGIFGSADDQKISGLDVKDVATVSSKIGSVTINGQVIGTTDGMDTFGIVAENMGAAKNRRHAFGAARRERQ